MRPFVSRLGRNDFANGALKFFGIDLGFIRRLKEACKLLWIVGLWFGFLVHEAY